MRRRKRLPIPQHEFGFVPNTFRLMAETTTDGERLCRERDEAAAARQKQEQAQTAHFIPEGKQ